MNAESSEFDPELYPDARPELRVFMPFLLAAPVAVLLAGGLLLVFGGALIEDHWSPATIALTHLGTLGFISMTLIGSLYAMVPMLTNRPLASPRLPSFVFGCLVLGIVALAAGLLLRRTMGVFIAIGTLFPALICFLLPMWLALRPRFAGREVASLRIAVGAMLLAAALGIWVAHGHGGMRFPGNRSLWLQVHLSIALLGWVGGYASRAVDLTVPRFQPTSSRSSDAMIRGLSLAGISAASVVLILDYMGVAIGSQSQAQRLASLGLLPAAVAVWILQPLAHATSLLRDRPTPAIRSWLTIFALAPIVALLSVWTTMSDEPAISLLFGWLAVWGWAGMIAHCTLQHWLPRVCSADLAASTHRTLERRAHGLHLASLSTGAIAIVSASDWMARLTGATLIVLAVVQLLGVCACCGLAQPGAAAQDR